MTIEELGSSPTMTEAEEIKAMALGAQMKVEEAVLAAEEQQRGVLQAALGTSKHSVAAPDLVDRNITGKEPVISPKLLEAALPLSEKAANTTRLGRTAIGDILLSEDDRLIVITGPCAIHSADEALEYARKVQGWREKYGDKLEIVMRAYFEKPRTELGWKGLVYDPRLDGSNDINLGLTLARLTALRITEMGVPIATERLKALTPQYTNSLIAYDAIGARTTTNPGSREYASGTSCPVGLKNTTDGGIEDAISAIVAANSPHSFLGIDFNGLPANVRTKGNPLAHIILRGGKDGPNFSAAHVRETRQQLRKRKLLEAIGIDASHGNSGKKAENQKIVVQDIAAQLAAGETAIKIVMMESNLVHGKQELKPGSDLEYGKSIVDACIDVDETEMLLEALAKGVVARREKLAR